MIKHDLSTLRRRLRALHDEMGDLTRILLGRDPLLKAYLSFTPRTCGNAGCKCRRGQKHPAWIVRLQEGRQVRMRSVSREVYERLKPLADSYREFRQAARRWRRLAREAETIIKDIERLREVDPDQTLQEERTHEKEEPEDGWTGGPDGDRGGV